jgi:hypothetical protein
LLVRSPIFRIAYPLLLLLLVAAGIAILPQAVCTRRERLTTPFTLTLLIYVHALIVQILPNIFPLAGGEAGE